MSIHYQCYSHFWMFLADFSSSAMGKYVELTKQALQPIGGMPHYTGHVNVLASIAVTNCCFRSGIVGKLTHCVSYCSQLWDRADLDTSFLTEKSSPQPGIKVHLEICFNFRVFCLIFNRLQKNLFLSVLLIILLYYFYHIWLKTVFIVSLLYAN